MKYAATLEQYAAMQAEHPDETIVTQDGHDLLVKAPGGEERIIHNANYWQRAALWAAK